MNRAGPQECGSQRKKTYQWVRLMVAAAVGWLFWPSLSALGKVCEPMRSVPYEGSWSREQFSVLDPFVVADSENGRLVLRVEGYNDPYRRFMTAMDQEVHVTWIDQGSASAGHHLGYFLKSVAEKKGYVRSDGSLDREALKRAIDFTDTTHYDPETFHYIWTCLRDDDGNGILDKPYGAECLRSFPESASTSMDYASSEEALAAIDDNTGLAFVPDGDGCLTTRDMTKSLGIIGEGQEIVFFIVPQGRFEDVYLSEPSWNRDVYTGLEPCTTTFADGTMPRKLQPAVAASDNGSCVTVSGWLSHQTLNRLEKVFGITFDPEQSLSIPLQTGRKFPHAVAASAPSTPGLRIMGWEDGLEGGDTDVNDVVCAVGIKAAGRVVSQDLSSERLSSEQSMLMAVDLTVTDRREPGDDLAWGFFVDSGVLSHANVRYAISADNGTSWIPVDRWDEVHNHPDGSQTRKVHLDLVNQGRSGRALKWKAVLETIDAKRSPPEILKVRLDYTASNQGAFSRSDPVVLGNVLYSAGMEPALVKQNSHGFLRGHLNAYLVYDPRYPTEPLFRPLWDAGRALADRPLDREPRTIYSAFFDAVSVREKVSTADGVSRHFHGLLSAPRVLSGSLVFRAVSSAGLPLILADTGVGILTGDGTGTFNRSTGEFDLAFVHPPCEGCSVNAVYAHATSPPLLQPFSEDTATEALLGLSDAQIQGAGFVWDMNADGRYDPEDQRRLVQWVLGFDNASRERPWPLDGIDHSTPSVVGPSGLPPWYFGTQTLDEERSAFDAWRQSKEVAQRQTVAYVGSLGGMIHAFQAGRYRLGDDPGTTFQENRGYFELQDYGDGTELWAFIPPGAMPRLKALLSPRSPLALPAVNASPSVQDLALQTPAGAAFRTVLVSAQGMGGEALFALDVTDPRKPEFLWEYADPALYGSRAAPGMARIGRLNDMGTPQWVVVVSSGQTGPQESPSLILLDAVQGTLIKKVSVDLGASNRGAVLSGSPTLVDWDGNGFVDRAYVADNKGNVVRVDFPDRADMPWDPARIQVSLLVKVSASVYATPVAYLAHRYRPDGSIAEEHVKVMFGTGDDPTRADSPNAPTGYKFYVFDDVCRMDWAGGGLRTHEGAACKAEGMQTEADAQWVWTLPAGHRIWAEAVAAAGMVYFGTAVSDTDDPCAPPQDDEKKGGKIYAVNLATLDDSAVPQLMAEAQGNVMALFVEDEHLYARVSSETVGSRVQVIGDGVFNNETMFGTRFITKKVTGSWRRILEK